MLPRVSVTRAGPPVANAEGEGGVDIGGGVRRDGRDADGAPPSLGDLGPRLHAGGMSPT